MIKKYLTFEEARKDLWVMKPNEEYYKHLRSLFAMWSRLAKKESRRGIVKGLRKA